MLDQNARMFKYGHELETYITNKAGALVKYGERYRNGDRISTGSVESTINQVADIRSCGEAHGQAAADAMDTGGSASPPASSNAGVE